MKLLSAATVLVAVLIATPVVGDHREISDEDLQARVAALIEMLASPNDPPEQRSSRDDVHFAKSHDRNKQVRVFAAFRALLAEDERVIDLLLAHKNDDRYSYSVNRTDVDANRSVSDACKAIAYKKIVGFIDELRPICSPPYFAFPPPRETKGGTKRQGVLAYWENNKDVGLATIQIRALDAMIESFETVDAATVPNWHPDIHERRPVDEFNKLRAENIKQLKAIRLLVSTTKKPYVTQQVDTAWESMFGIAGSSRRWNK